MADGRQNALILDERRGRGLEPPLQLLERLAQDHAVSAWGDGIAMVEVGNAEGTGVIVQTDLLGFEHLAVRLAEDGKENFLVQARSRRGMPGDVEEVGVGRGGTILEDVVPPHVFVAHDAHVIGHGVENLAHAVRV